MEKERKEITNENEAKNSIDVERVFTDDGKTLEELMEELLKQIVLKACWKTIDNYLSIM